MHIWWKWIRGKLNLQIRCFCSDIFSFSDISKHLECQSCEVVFCILNGDMIKWPLLLNQSSSETCIFFPTFQLLMCGIEEYSIADFKANHEVNGSSPEFRRVLYWFWTAVSNFTGKSSGLTDWVREYVSGVILQFNGEFKTDHHLFSRYRYQIK